MSYSLRRTRITRRISNPIPEKVARSSKALKSFAREEVETIADVLGFTPGSSLDSVKAVERIDGCMMQFDGPQLQAIFSLLAATYLPMLIDEVLRRDPIVNKQGLSNFINGYVIAIESIQRFSPGYLVNYMMSSDPNVARQGRRLPGQIAQLMGIALLLRTDYLEEGYRLLPPMRSLHFTSYRSIIRLLLFLIAWLPDSQRPLVFSPKLRDFLSNKVTCWMRWLPGTDCATTDVRFFGEFLVALKGGKWDMEVLVMEMSQNTMYPTIVTLRDAPARCHLQACDKVVPPVQMYQCSRCKSVLYCSKQHQKADWDDVYSPHAAMCHRTSW